LLRISLVPTRQSDSVYTKQILCFKNVKILKENHIDCFRYAKVYVDRFMRKYAIYTRITNAFVFTVF